MLAERLGKTKVVGVSTLTWVEVEAGLGTEVELRVLRWVIVGVEDAFEDARDKGGREGSFIGS